MIEVANELVNGLGQFEHDPSELTFAKSGFGVILEHSSEFDDFDRYWRALSLDIEFEIFGFGHVCSFVV